MIPDNKVCRQHWTWSYGPIWVLDTQQLAQP